MNDQTKIEVCNNSFLWYFDRTFFVINGAKLYILIKIFRKIYILFGIIYNIGR